MFVGVARSLGASAESRSTISVREPENTTAIFSRALRSVKPGGDGARSNLAKWGGAMMLVVKGVPAQVCANCGEEYIDGDITAGLLQAAEGAAQAGVQVNVRQYIAV